MNKKTNKKMNVKFKPRNKKTVAIVLGVSSIIVMATLCTLFIPVPMDVMKTNYGEFYVTLAGLEIANPYDVTNEKFVVFSDNYGNPYIDSSRTTWKDSTSETIYSAFNIDPNAANKPTCYKETTRDVNHIYGWVYGTSCNGNFYKLAKGNYWYGPSGCTVDPDAKNTGVPNLDISINNLYASDSNGNQAADYAHKKITRTLLDANGNVRNIELHTGFITLQVTFSVRPDYFVDPYLDGLNQAILSECVGHSQVFWTLWNSLGAILDFNAVFRFQITSLLFDDIWQLNPDWINLGNGILSVQKRGFSLIEVLGEDEQYLVATLDTSSWRDPGSNDIITHQADSLQKFSSKELALDKTDALPSDATTITDFKANNPDVVYFSNHNGIALGMHGAPGFFGQNDKLASISMQSITWTQKFTIGFYTSICEPMGGQVDPVIITTIYPVPPPQERLWDKFINWLAGLFGVNTQQATMIFIAVCAVVGSIILLLLFPQIIPLIGRGIGAVFGNMWKAMRLGRKSARRARRGDY